ncbi:MAG: hypothetical protein HOY78_48595 [Saccharothrix sp.]|nr:hypothetical protein [Saccharothrix sp.]
MTSRVVCAVGAVALLLFVGSGSALANSFYTGGNASSVWNFTTGSTSYTQSHGGDDFAFDVTSGIAVDMRWSKCSDSSVHGEIKYNIGVSDGYRVLGTNFLASTCLHIQYRGYSQTGSFNGWTYWNYNFA